MSLAVITINNPSPALDKRAQEVQIVARACDLARQAIASAGGQSASGTITDAGVTLGTWTYTAVAAS
jgi:hypothetical protein